MSCLKDGVKLSTLLSNLVTESYSKLKEISETLDFVDNVHRKRVILGMFHP